MTREEFRAKWTARRAEWEKLGVLLGGAKICEEFVADFEDVLTSHDEAVLNTNQAAADDGLQPSAAAALVQAREAPGTQEPQACVLPGRRSAEEAEWRAAGGRAELDSDRRRDARRCTAPCGSVRTRSQYDSESRHPVGYEMDRPDRPCGLDSAWAVVSLVAPGGRSNTT